MNWYKKAQDQEKVLFIMRGVPGSGKSTLAKELAKGGLILSTDEYFMVEGKYMFNPQSLYAAHQWNQERALKAMQQGITPLVIDNTNVTFKDMRYYVEQGKNHGYRIEFAEPNTPWKFDVDELVKKNTHGVPRETIERMVGRWQKDPTVEKILN